MNPTFSADELYDLTKRRQQCKQLAILHGRGFHRAYIATSGELVLERAHYDAVCRGQAEKPRKAANISFLTRAA